MLILLLVALGAAWSSVSWDELSPRRTPPAARRDLTPHFTCSGLAAWFPARVHPAVVLQMVNGGYVDIQQNFVRLMEKNSRFTRDNIFLLCVDHESVGAVKALGIRCVPMVNMPHRTQGHAVLWKMRVRVLGCLLETGFDVIVSDSDALWLGDPTEDFVFPANVGDPVRQLQLPGIGNSDIIASRGGFPQQIRQVWGSTMCMGFAFFRSSGAGMREYLSAMEKSLAHTGDDQVAVNFVAKELAILWDSNSDMRYLGSTGVGRGVIADLGGSNFTVTLLPHSMYTRNCDKTPISNATVVAHCRSRKKIGDKISWMKQANLWGR